MFHCVYIPLPNTFAFVDMEDADVSFFVWSEINGYAGKDQGKKLLHTFIMERMLGKKISVGVIVCHKNKNKLDNRRENLELRRKGSTGIKEGRDLPIGVWKKQNRYFARVRDKKQEYYLGSFLTKRAAAIAYNEKSKEVFGIYAILNEIEEG